MNRHLARLTDESSNPEMASVLFMDIVRYSLLSMKEQKSVRSELNEIALNCDEFRVANESNAIISLPTGDGLALNFFRDPAAPVRCAIEISRSLKRCPDLKVRMGIHSGPVYRDIDINQQNNVAGGGINIAQRVMDFGDAGHILISRATAEILIQLGGWKPHLFPLGEGEDKHGERVYLYNFYNDEVGNPNLPAKLVSKPEPSRLSGLKPANNKAANTASTGERLPKLKQRHSSTPEGAQRSLKGYCPKCGMLLHPGEVSCIHCGT